MFGLCRFILLFALLAFSSASENLGVNLTVDEGGGARYSGLANTYLGFKGDETSGAYFPAALNDHDDLTVNIDYMQKFGELNYNHFSLVLPFHQSSTLSLSVSRVSVSGIERHSSSNPLFPDEGTLNIADYLLSGAVARRWGSLDIGGSLHIIYRKLDQKGLGIRGDLSSQFRFLDKFYLGLLIKGAVPSSVRWQSDYFEYSPPDIFAGLGLELPSDYFYGVFRFAVQTKGLFQREAKSGLNLLGRRIHESPADILKTCSAGLEYQLDFGLNLRFGLSEIWGQTKDFYPAFGVGYNFRNFLNLNYSFMAHPDLLSTHRISLSISPYFKKGKFQRPQENAKTSAPLKPQSIHQTIDPDLKQSPQSKETPGKELGPEESKERLPAKREIVTPNDESGQTETPEPDDPDIEMEVLE